MESYSTSIDKNEDPLDLILLFNKPELVTSGGINLFTYIGPGHLSYLHYIANPVANAPENNIYGKRLAEYTNFLRKHNGCMLYDKSIIIYSFGCKFTRSIDLDSIVITRFEDENPGIYRDIVEINRKKYISVGMLDLDSTFDLLIGIDGCLYILSNKVVIATCTINTFLTKVIKSFDDYIKRNGAFNTGQLLDIETSIMRSLSEIK